MLASWIAFEVNTGEQWRTGEHGILASWVAFVKMYWRSVENVEHIEN